MSMVALCAVAQNNTISPYSKFGIGLYESDGFGRNHAMGGTGIALRSRMNTNNINPASYASIDSTMVMFDIGMHLDYEYVESSLESGSRMNGNISYFSFTIAPTNRYAVSFGIAPYTSTGYSIQSEEYLAGGGQQKYVSYVEGLGGLTKVYLGTGINIFKNTSIGMNASVVFGPKTENQTLYLPTSSMASGVFVENSDYYVGGKLDFGLQQSFKLSKKNEMTVGLIASTPGILRCDRTEYMYNTYGQILDTIYYDDDDADRYTNIPENYGAGISFVKDNRITISADFRYNPLSKFDVKDHRSKLLDSKTICVGMEYIPQRVGRNYDLAFRFGGCYETGTYKVDSYTLNSLSLTAGVGFRIRSIRFSTFCMYKRQGTLDKLLVLDQKLRFGLNLTYIDYWFQKRKFN